MKQWYRKLKTPGSRTERIKYAMNSKSKGFRNRKPLRVRDPKFIFYRAYSSAVYMGGYKVKTCSRFQIAKFFGVEVSTIILWAKLGVLPPPFMHQQRGVTRYPVYLASQIRCLVVVVNDLVKEGYVSIQWSRLPEHLAMLQDGYAVALEAFHRRAGFHEDDEPKGKFGVVYED